MGDKKAKAPRARRPNPIARWFKRYTLLKVISILSAVYIAFWSYAPVGTFGTTGGFVTRKDGPSWPSWQSQEGLNFPGYVLDVNSEENNDYGVVFTAGSVGGPLAWWQPEEGGSKRAIVANSDLQMCCLGITRISAFFMYPSLVMVMTTKFRATMEMLFNSGLGMYTYDDLHELHVFCGWVVIVDGILHTIFHIVRWADQSNMYLLWEHPSGLSGLFTVICVFLIGPPMAIEFIRKRIPYEVRKYMHYFFVVMMVALSFHAPLSTLPNGGLAPIIFPILILWYTLDSLYVYLYMTEKIDTSKFHVTSTGVQLTMTVSERFQKRGNSGGYCYVNFPWINKYQWHAYSLFENPSNPKERQIYIQDLGDWTHKVLQALQRDTRRPVWVMGPFSSPYDNAVDMDNQILVAGGIGITPAISVMRKHAESRRSNLIWAVRDPHMLEFFLKHGSFSARGWNLVFYTGKQPLYVGDTNEVVTSTGALVHIIRSRPKLQDLIPNIIYSIESGEFVPEEFVSEAKIEAVNMLQEKLAELDGMHELTSRDKMAELINYADSLGFLFTDLMGEVAKGDVELESKMKKMAQETAAPAAAPAAPEPVASKRMDPPEKMDDETLAAIRTTDVHSMHQRATMARQTSMGAKPRETTTLKNRATVVLNAVGSGMAEWMESGGNLYLPWEENSEESRAFVSELGTDALSTWGCLYCGGQGPLADSLKKTIKEFGLHCGIESFKW